MKNLDGEELDLALHECMAEIWKGYRASVASGNYRAFNDAPRRLYAKYTDERVVLFIREMAFSLIWSATTRIEGMKGEGQ